MVDVFEVAIRSCLACSLNSLLANSRSLSLASVRLITSLCTDSPEYSAFFFFSACFLRFLEDPCFLLPILVYLI